MTDDVPDKAKQKHGVMWYVGWMLVLYVASYLPATVAWHWYVIHESNVQRVTRAYATFYWPIRKAIVEFGLRDYESRFVLWGLNLLS